MGEMFRRCVEEIVGACAAQYNFDASECMNMVLAPGSSRSSSKKSSSSSLKKEIPLPFMREHVSELACQGIKFNHGLFTQCKNERANEILCITCAVTNCGTIESRMSADFKDSRGRRPSSYISVLRKLKLTQEDAMVEAGKVNILLNDSHFVEQVKEVKVKEPKVKEVKVKVIKEPKVKEVKVKVIKEPKVKEVKVKVIKEPKVKEVKEKVVKEKVIKEPKVKEVKVKVIKEPKVKEVKEKVGRPKSSKNAIETVSVEDLFASLVAEEEVAEEVFGQNNEDEQALNLLREVNITNDLKKVVTLKKAELKAESKERKEMQLEEMEQKKIEKANQLTFEKEQKEQKALALTLEKEQKANQAALEKEQKALALTLEKEQKANQLAFEKEQKANQLALEKEQKALAAAAAKQEKAEALALDKELKAIAKEKVLAEAKAAKEAKAKPKVVAVAVAAVAVAAVAAVAAVVAEKPVKVTVKRVTIDGKEYLKSSNNMLYDAVTKEEAGIWNPVTESIDELPEESDDEEVEDDYESDSN